MTYPASKQEDRFHCRPPMVGLTKAHPKYGGARPNYNSTVLPKINDIWYVGEIKTSSSVLLNIDITMHIHKGIIKLKLNCVF